MGADDTKKGDTVALQADDTFEIRFDGRTLKFEMDRTQRSVKFVSVSPPPPKPPSADDIVGRMSSAALLRAMTKSSLQEQLLKKLSQSKYVVFSDVIHTNKDLLDSLEPITKFSYDMTKGGGTKPLVVLRVADKGGAASRVNIDKAMRSIRGQNHALDAHIVRIPGAGKKSEP